MTRSSCRLHTHRAQQPRASLSTSPLLSREDSEIETVAAEEPHRLEEGIGVLVRTLVLF